MSRRASARRSQTRARQRWIVVGVAVLAVLALTGLAFAVLGGGDGEQSAAAPAAKTSPSTTTTTVFVPTAPLTGLPDRTNAAQTRAALSVKIENSPDSRPQSGLEVADVVYEEIVEGGITRFWAVFHTTAPANVGPIRSVRYMDPNIVTPIGGVIAFSGGTSDNVNLIRQTPTVQVDENNAGDAFFREPTRFAPHNLFGVTERLWSRGGEPVPPRPLFTYLPKGKTFEGDGIDQFRVGFQAGYDPTYSFDAASRTWKRSYGLEPFNDASGNQIAPTNVVVQFINYPRGAEGELIGEGEAWVFSDNKLLRGRWVKPNAETPTQFLTAFGVPIELTPGRTWVELAANGTAVDLVPSPPPPPTTLPPATTTTKAKKQK